MKHFNEYKRLDLPALSKEVLEMWEKENLFEKSVSTREGHPQFLFFEGPPSANGMPGIHHVMARTIKDTFCRFKTMQGFQVRRKAGWDTHGLPVELGVEKMLGITKEDIGKKISVDEYNAACRREVMKYTKEWTNLTKQMGYWVDLDNPYITYDNKYIETLWYLLKELYKKGYLYKGYTIQPYSPAAGTGLSSHELNQPGCYRDVKDLTCTAKFHLKDGRYIIAWTTTPWTLPSNTALCVGPKIDYVEIKLKDENGNLKEESIILAEARLSAYFENAEIVARYKGADLVGLEYDPLFPWVNPGPGAFRVIPGDYVTTEDGTGIVHIAPTFGADDKKVGDAAGVPGLYMQTKNYGPRPMVDFTGKYWKIEDLDPEWVAANVNTELYGKYAGRFVKNAYDPNLTDKDETLDLHLCLEMKADGRLLRTEKHVHSYPHCWRTDKPVIYYPLDSWFIKSTMARDEMIALNQTINWQPESTGTGRFGQWLNNLNDWNLSRSRYWGTPLPIWRTEDGSEEICIGSIAELFDEIDKSVKAGFMKANPWPNHKPGDYSKANYDPSVIDLHRPYVDSIILVSPSGKPMKRELDLIDVWFDSGAMPYAQNHYPFENADAPRTADFISEGVDQTRGWFFTLHAIHTMIEGTVAYRNVISNGLVLDKNGNKMSKRLGNAVDPFGALETYGADPVRWYMLTNSSPWENLKFDPEGVDEVRRKFFGTLYNTYSFFALYANVDSWQPAGSLGNDTAKSRQRNGNDGKGRTEIDLWILSKLNSLVKEVTEAYEAYEPTKAGRAISDFVQDDLSNWYVRLNRKRFWGGEMDADKQAAYETLYTCLKTVAQLMAPNAPFYADRLYRDLTDETVHLSEWPKVNEELIDLQLERQMYLAQQATSTILSLRKRAEKNVRQPLQKAVIPTPDQETADALCHVADLVKSEVNVKELVIVPAEQSEIRLVKKIKPQFKVLGKKVGANMKAVAAEIASMTQDQIAQMEAEGSYTLHNTPYTLIPEDVEIITEDMPGWLVANNGILTIALDIELTDELIEEGIARELINRIQNLRKSSGLEITDRIKVLIEDREEIHNAVLHCNDYIASQVLATSLELNSQLSTLNSQPIEMDGYNVNINIQKA
ncbi:MAG: isoleucine--tRNA ligase [Paludibacteraceae bacterium]|nr:isoleucine--tRNA ligase [Paludibacteraceae bacterium]